MFGDIVFYLSGLGARQRQHTDPDGGAVLAYRVSNPTEHGAVELDADLRVGSPEEWPIVPRSDRTVASLYCCEPVLLREMLSSRLPRTSRWEQEVGSRLQMCSRAYLEQGRMAVEVLPRGTIWLDTGALGSLAKESGYVHTAEARRGTKIGCPEE